jgi:hypothetical protein
MMYNNLFPITNYIKWDCSHLMNRSPYQTSFSRLRKRNTNRTKPQSVKKNKRKQQQLSRKINRSK